MLLFLIIFILLLIIPFKNGVTFFDSKTFENRDKKGRFKKTSTYKLKKKSIKYKVARYIPVIQYGEISGYIKI